MFLTKRLFSVVIYWATLPSAFDLDPAFLVLLLAYLFISFNYSILNVGNYRTNTAYNKK